MKLYVFGAVILTLIGLSLAVVLGNGQPGCKTDAEISVKFYRNLWDPTSYWICEEKGVPASSGKCDDTTAWFDAEKTCVDWELWAWEDPIEPPSSP